MKKIYTLLMFGCFLTNYSQAKIVFTYDEAGNQIYREFICINCDRQTITPQEPEFKKLLDDENINFYPNPVSEDLFLKWQISNEKQISSIQLFTINGVNVRNINGLEQTENQIINFQTYAEGNYILFFTYTDGSKKSIKIIKK